MDIFNNLNQQQLAVIQHINGPVIVSAGAGTGKTRTLTARIANMVTGHNIDPQTILAITFTKKAANEMRERIVSSIGPSAMLITISTIHSFCARILRRHIELLDYRHDFEIIDDDEGLKIVNDIYKAENFDKKQLTPKFALHAISSHKNGIFPLVGLINKVYDKYQKYLKANNMVDFDDLLLLVQRLFSEQPEVLKYYQNMYHYVLVDEFQDTNRVQYDIIHSISMIHQNIFVVGDEDQSIYAFRGASATNFNDLERDFPDVKIYKLETNYRSTDAILQGANSLIHNNEHHITKELHSNIPGNYHDIVLNELYYFEDESRFVTNEISSLLNKGYKPSEIAILYRSSVISRNFEMSLIDARIPYKIYGSFSYLKRREIKDVLSYLRFIIDPNSYSHFRRIINQPARGIGEKTIVKIKECADENHISLFDAIDEINWTSPSTKSQVLIDFKQMIIDLQKQIENMPIVKFFDVMLDKTGYLQKIREEAGDEVDREQNVMDFKSILYKIEENYSEENLSKIEVLQRGFDDAMLDESLGENTSADGVIMSTIHSVKGLEYKVVFMVAMEEGIFPILREDTDMEEERRIAYVAITRAKEKIYFTCATRRLIYGRIVRNQKSRFLTEFIASKGIEASLEDRNSHQKVEGEIVAGDHVYHSNFGYGLVVAVDSMSIQVLFDRDHSLRKILKTHPAIEKC